jgi:hypothetical protein
MKKAISQKIQNKKNLEWDSVRKPWQKIILNLQNNASIADANYQTSGDVLWIHQYHSYVDQLIKLKEYIKEEERKLFF